MTDELMLWKITVINEYELSVVSFDLSLFKELIQNNKVVVLAEQFHTMQEQRLSGVIASIVKMHCKNGKAVVVVDHRNYQKIVEMKKAIKGT